MYETHEERYSQEELAQRIWAVEQVKKLAAKRFYYQAAERRAEELDELWVREPDHQAGASLGSNWGYYTGMDQIRAYYVTAHDARRRAHRVPRQRREGLRRAPRPPYGHRGPQPGHEAQGHHHAAGSGSVPLHEALPGHV